MKNAFKYDLTFNEPHDHSVEQLQVPLKTVPKNSSKPFSSDTFKVSYTHDLDDKKTLELTMPLTKKHVINEDIDVSDINSSSQISATMPAQPQLHNDNTQTCILS